ncbi:MAG: D-alanyl-D-alanine carboxypeptidase family protein [Hyphomicrobiaceae bacterium]
MAGWTRTPSGGAAALSMALAMMLPSATLSANPLLLFEPARGQVLYAEEPDRPWHPASVTKLMTAYLTFEAVKGGRLAWDADVPLSEHARSQPATRIGLRGGIALNVEQAVRGLILRSANDFAAALAERVGGTEAAFVDQMNATAKRLGMTRTVFRNPHGLPDAEQVTTARDLAILTTALLADFPDRAEVFSTPTVRIHKGTFHSQNDLLRTLEGGDGMKTGFTCASGYNVVASATRDGRRLIAVVLGAVNRQKRSEKAAELIEAGFAYLARTEGVARTEPRIVAAAHRPRETQGDLGGEGAHRHKSASPRAELIQAMAPHALKDLPISPAEAVAAEDMGKQVRSGKCRGYSGFGKKDGEPVASESEPGEDGTATAITTGSIAQGASADGPGAAPGPSAPVAAAAPAAPVAAAAAIAAGGLASARTVKPFGPPARVRRQAQSIRAVPAGAEAKTPAASRKRTVARSRSRIAPSATEPRAEEPHGDGN